MFPSIPGWSPVNPDSGAAFEKTILGSFLHCSTIRPNTPRDLTRPYVSPYFNRSINLSPNDMQVGTWAESTFPTIPQNTCRTPFFVCMCSIRHGLWNTYILYMCNKSFKFGKLDN